MASIIICLLGKGLIFSDVYFITILKQVKIKMSVFLKSNKTFLRILAILTILANLLNLTIVLNLVIVSIYNAITVKLI